MYTFINSSTLLLIGEYENYIQNIREIKISLMNEIHI